MKQFITVFVARSLIIGNILAENSQSVKKDGDTKTTQATVGSVMVKTWADDKKSAFSFSFDDAKITQFTNARPILDQYGLKGTFYIVTDNVRDVTPYWEYGLWWQFDSLAHEGHEIAAHTVTHTELNTIPVGDTVTPNTIAYEMYQSKKIIEQKIPGFKCISFAYPYCTYDNTIIGVAQNYFESARTCGSYSDPSNISGTDFFQIQAVDIYFDHPRGITTDDDAFYVYTFNVINQSIDTRGWANFFAHDILPWDEIPDTSGSDTTKLSTYFMDKLCNWVKAESDSGNIWEETIGNVTRYIKERENFTSNVVSSTSTQIELSTAIGALDQGIYNYPLTIDIAVPSDWPAVTVKQGNIIIADSLIPNGSTNIVRINIVPGKENVILTEKSLQSNCIVNLKVFLEGAYNGSDTMTTYLNYNNLIPLNSNSAYSTTTYNYSASTVASIPDSDIVDWILVELRTGTADSTKAATRAGFLKSDGTIVDIDGSSRLSFSGVTPGNYYVVVRHRNHLGIMSSSAISLNSNSALYDFTTAQSQAYTSGTDPMAALSGNSFGMIAGDADNNGTIDYENDLLIQWVPNFGLYGYYPADFNLNGTVDYTDDVLRLWIKNFGFTSQVL